jgi:hypothetical protein
MNQAPVNPVVVHPATIEPCPTPDGTECDRADRSISKVETAPATSLATSLEPILCEHCQRTATNGIKCKGICIADSSY